MTHLVPKDERGANLGRDPNLLLDAFARGKRGGAARIKGRVSALHERVVRRKLAI